MASHLNYFGTSGLIVESLGEIVTDIYGLETCTATYKAPQQNYGLVPAMFTNHPFLTYLHMERRRVSFVPGFLVIQAEYAGIPGSNTVPIFELIWGTSEEPIETHPAFVSDIAGTPSSPLNGAIFLDETGQLTTDDSRGIFDGFRSGSEFAGVTSFLDLAQMTWRQTYLTVNRPSDLTGVGHIGSPSGPAPSPPGGNWLYVGVTYQQRGLVYSVQQEWRGSGINGWNETIYG